ncbi:hypothetical protein FJU30_19190 [Affinibrenneria salicis]|uniref:Uncharacterized protein n=1 Tax=Affinibrenneria salicis TaxID=2590031 RepID=A0A5J5FUX9_9GAMM|nr:hypothetical protein [Affinibrenneria salicis]KAA8997362.1 hypothetical protein FJU30_19190 [Affinibrenneria salicis]
MIDYLCHFLFPVFISLQTFIVTAIDYAAPFPDNIHATKDIGHVSGRRKNGEYEPAAPILFNGGYYVIL